ncbi:MAG TPA: hypothetical protein VF334_00290, partial [Polyangia bacterium]
IAAATGRLTFFHVMLQLATMVPSLNGQVAFHGWWWLVLLAIIFGLVMPLAWMWSRGRGGTQQ